MNCDEAEILLHGLVDNEIDAEHACRVEAHVEGCSCCTAQLHLHRALRAMISNADLRFSAPPGLRKRIKAILPTAAPDAPYRRTLFRGFAFGSALSAAAAALLMIAVIRSDQDKVVVVGTGVPSLVKKYLPSGAVRMISFWDSSIAGYAMNKLAVMVLKGQKVTDGMDLGLPGYEKIRLVNDKIIYGNGWIDCTKENMDKFNF